MLSRVYAFTAWVIVSRALAHAYHFSDGDLQSKRARARTFFGSGLAIALVGTLNLLHRAYGNSALGLRVVCRSANTVLLLFAGWRARLPSRA